MAWKLNPFTGTLDETSSGVAGDMVLGSIQSVTGLKTFDTTKLAVKGSSTGSTAVASANASVTDYTATLPAKTGTVAMTSDITGTNSGTNTGDQTLPTRASLGLDTTDSPQFAGVNIGHATDTTLTRVSAGVIAIEGATVPTLASTNVWTAPQRGTVTSITSTTNSIAIELNTTNNFTHTLTENTTLANPTSTPVVGQTGSIIFTQHASAAKTLAFGSQWKAATGTAGVLSTTVGTVNLLTYTVVSTSEIIYGFATKGVA